MLLRVLTALARSAVTHRGRWLIGLALAVVVGLLGASRLHVRLEAEDIILHVEDPDTETRRVLEAFRHGERLVVVLSDSAAIPVTEAATVLEAVADQLAAIPGIRAVRHRLPPAQQRAMLEHFQRNILLYLDSVELQRAAGRLGTDSIAAHLAMANDRMLPLAAVRARDPLELRGLVLQALHPILRGIGVRVVDGYFTVPTQRRFFVVLEVAKEHRGLTDVARLVDTIEATLHAVRADPALASALGDRRLALLGRPASVARAFQIIRGDLGRVGLLATIGVLALVAAFFRDARAPLILVLPVGLGLIAAGAVAGGAFGSISLAGWIFIPVLVGLGVDFGIHVLSHYWCVGDVGDGRRDAAVSAVRRPGRGIALGGLTSAAAFLALVAISVPVMHEIGWLAAAALVTMVAASVTAVPLALSWTAPARRPAAGRWSTRLGGPGGGAVGVLPWLLLLGGALVALPRIQYQWDSRATLGQADPTFIEYENFRTALGQSLAPRTIVSVGTTIDEALARDRYVVERLSTAGPEAGIAGIASLAHWVPDPVRQAANRRYLEAHPAAFSTRRVRRDFRIAARRLDLAPPDGYDEYLHLLEAALHPPGAAITVDGLRAAGFAEEVDRHIAAVDGGYAVATFVTLRAKRGGEDAGDRYAAAVRALGVDTLAGVTLGASGSIDRFTRRLQRDALVATSLAFLLIVALLGGHFRSVRAILLCIVPLGAGLAAIAVAMVAFGIPLGVLTMTVAPILVGLGVDDGIHVVDRLLDGQAVEAVLREAGGSMTLTTVTSVVAFSSLALARFPGLWEVGVLGAVGLVAALAASLHLVPWCASALGWAAASTPVSLPVPRAAESS